MTTESDVANIKAMLLELGEPLARKALARTAVELEQYVRDEGKIHTKSTNMNSALSKRKRQDGDMWDIFYDLRRAHYAVYVLFGTKPHVILPKDKKMLRWAKDGKFYSKYKVNHPGNKPDNSLERAKEKFPSVFENHIKTLLKGIKK